MVTSQSRRASHGERRSESTRARAPRELLVLVVARCVNRLGGFSMSFLGVRLVTDLHADLARAGLVLALFGLATIPSRVLGGLLAPVLGHRITMVVGLLACAGAQAVIALSTSLSTAVAGAILLGLAYEVVEPPSQAMVADLVPLDRLPGAYALLWSSMSVAGVLAGVLAALVLPWGTAPLFWVDAATSATCAVVCLTMLPRDRPEPAAGPSGRQALDGRRTGGRRWMAARSSLAGMRAALHDASLLRHTLVGTVLATTVMVVVLLLPLSIALRGMPPSTTGLLLAVDALASVATSLALGRIGPRWSRRRTLVTGYLVLAASLVGVALSTTPVALVTTSAVGAVANVLLLGTNQAIAADLATTPDRRPAYLAVFGLSWGVGTVVAPLLGTTSTQLAGLAGPWWCTALLALGLAGVVGLSRAAAGRDRPVS